jgi:casein kinase II subunit alpha
LESKICLFSYPKKQWNKFVTNENSHLCSNEALDLLSKMLVYDHADRITPKDAMEHEYFASVKEYHLKNKK